MFFGPKLHNNRKSIHPERKKMTQANKTIHKKKNTTSGSQKNGNHLQNTLISPTATPEPTPNTNQQQVQY